MDEYLNAIYPPASPMSKVLQSLPMPVLKADILRYTVLLHKGGIYSDIDTAAVRKFDDWGQGAGDMVRVTSDSSQCDYELHLYWNRPIKSSPMFLAC